MLRVHHPPTMPEIKEGLYTRIGIVFVPIVGALSILGAPLMIAVPIMLFVIGWGFGAREIYTLSKKHHWNKLHWIFQAGAFLILIWCVYSAYYIFAVQMNVRTVTARGIAVGQNTFADVEFGVQLTNRGKPTSLTAWKAFLITPDGKKITGEIQRFEGEGATVIAHSGPPVTFALPECDLAFETVRAMQAGDSVFGLVLFRFYGAQASPLSPDTKVVLEARDVLDRKIDSQEIRFGDLNSGMPDLFPCPLKRDVTPHPTPSP
jgi:hypothetical protein